MTDLNGKQILMIGQAEALTAVTRVFENSGAKTRVISDMDSLSSNLEAGNPLDAAVIGVGWEAQKPFMETTAQEWQDALKINFEQAVLATQTVAKHMIAGNKTGHIVMLSSAFGLKSYRDRSAMGTTLAALHAVARIAAVDLGAYGIKINVVALGATSWRDLSGISADIPLGRVAEMKDIGEMCCFLASDAASYITGAIIPVDGGYSITKVGAGTVKT